MTNSSNDEDKSTTSSSTTSSVPEEEIAKTPPASSSASNEAVYKLASNDVLMGRGAAVIGNEGNRRFRKLIQKFKSEYDATRIRQEKDRIARKIVENIISRGGRFLKKIETPAQMELYKVKAGKTAWAIVQEAVVLQKVKQAFRDDRRSLDEGDSNHSPQQGGISSPALLKPAHGGGLPKSSPLGGAGLMDSLLGDSSLLGNPSLVNAALMMNTSTAASSSSLGSFLPFHHQQLLNNQLDSQMIAQLLYARQQQLDPLAALRNQALLAEENRRVLLLRQVLARQQQNNGIAQHQEALAALNRQAALREQLAVVGQTPSPKNAAATRS
mmetsp:Transcript_19615/g.37094  ORF Transcript_19615/g.37094 Transcript_19615/m.37094 type:complete len:327 (-) Transcript_19615:27-1007(-)